MLMRLVIASAAAIALVGLPAPLSAQSNCDSAYPDEEVCIPSPPPDLDCADITYRNFTVYILQIAMGWSDDHLNCFTIHGKEYGVYHSGGIEFSDDPETVRLADLQLREREKFRYEYDFTDRWQHQLRVEAIQSLDQPLSAPICIACSCIRQEYNDFFAFGA